MPVLSGVSSLASFVPLLNELYADGVLVTRNSPTQVLAGNEDVRFSFLGTGLMPITFDSVLAGFGAGVITTVKIREADSDTVLVSLTGLSIDVESTNALSDGAALLAYLSQQKWTINGTAGADSYNLSNTSGFHTRANTVLNLRAGDDVATGGLGKDRLLGGYGNDTLKDSAGNDVALGGTGNDLLSLGKGANGNDTLKGGGGDDTIQGGKGNDDLAGDAGNDRLNGGSGSDVLSGGTGVDTLTGGTGADAFVYRGVQGNDTITDFTLDVDTIRIDASSVTIVEVDGGTVVRYDGTRIMVEGVAAEDLVIGDSIILI